jgi:mono/diheme cytochrome c family protein
MRRLGRRQWAVLVVFTGLLVGACIPSSPSYPFDVFPEMHYGQGHRPGEPPRRSPPAEAVPVTGRAPSRSLDEAAQLQNPLPPGPETVARGQALFRLNCQPCHGQAGKGDGRVAPYFQAAKVPPPADLTSDRVRSRTDGQLYAIIDQGLGAMPPFGHLLSDEERWALVAFIRSLQQ